jgi:hypothetical protein
MGAPSRDLFPCSMVQMPNNHILKSVLGCLAIALSLAPWHASRAADHDYELKENGVHMIVEINKHGTALLVINKSADPITIIASDLVFEWNGKSASPCGLSILNLMGIGVSGPVGINPGDQTGAVLGGCAPLGAPFIVPSSVTVKIKGKKLRYVGIASPH